MRCNALELRFAGLEQLDGDEALARLAFRRDLLAVRGARCRGLVARVPHVVGAEDQHVRPGAGRGDAEGDGVLGANLLGPKTMPTAFQ